MARTDTLPHFLTDVADAIRTKKGSSDTIQASNFDTEIENLPSGGGADLSEYFYTEITENTSGSSTLTDKIIKKMPEVVISDNVTSLQYAYNNLNGTNLPSAPKLVSNDNLVQLNGLFSNSTNIKTIDVSRLNTSNVTNMNYMFGVSQREYTLTTIIFSENFKTTKVANMQQMFIGRGGLKNLDLSTFTSESCTTTYRMFSYCGDLNHIDFRNFDFTTIGTTTDMFGSSSSNGVPDNCEIIVKDTTQKSWINNNFTRLTNVKTVAEYEAE